MYGVTKQVTWKLVVIALLTEFDFDNILVFSLYDQLTVDKEARFTISPS